MLSKIIQWYYKVSNCPYTLPDGTKTTWKEELKRAEQRRKEMDSMQRYDARRAAERRRADPRPYVDNTWCDDDDDTTRPHNTNNSTMMW